MEDIASVTTSPDIKLGRLSYDVSAAVADSGTTSAVLRM